MFSLHAYNCIARKGKLFLPPKGVINIQHERRTVVGVYTGRMPSWAAGPTGSGGGGGVWGPVSGLYGWFLFSRSILRNVIPLQWPFNWQMWRKNVIRILKIWLLEYDELAVVFHVSVFRWQCSFRCYCRAKAALQSMIQCSYHGNDIMDQERIRKFWIWKPAHWLTHSNSPDSKPCGPCPRDRNSLIQAILYASWSKPSFSDPDPKIPVPLNRVPLIREMTLQVPCCASLLKFTQSPLLDPLDLCFSGLTYLTRASLISLAAHTCLDFPWPDLPEPGSPICLTWSECIISRLDPPNSIFLGPSSPDPSSLFRASWFKPSA